MASLNKIQIIGNLGRDPEVSYSQSGLAIAKFSVATTFKEDTDWHRVVMFDKLAEIAAQYLVKGSLVYIEGRLKYGSYEKDGVKHYTTDIIAFQMQMLGSKDKGEPKTGFKPPEEAPVSDEPEEDEDLLPF